MIPAAKFKVAVYRHKKDRSNPYSKQRLKRSPEEPLFGCAGNYRNLNHIAPLEARTAYDAHNLQIIRYLLEAGNANQTRACVAEYRA